MLTSKIAIQENLDLHVFLAEFQLPLHLMEIYSNI